MTSVDPAHSPARGVSLSSSPLESEALSPEAILSRAGGENFPVVLRGLPIVLREDLLALYSYARLVDQVGDEAGGDRMEMLEALSADLLRIRDSKPVNAILRRLALVVRRHDLPLETLERLIEANRRDQDLRSVATWAELVDTCTRSANPVGELVLGIFDSRSDHTVELSDAVCTALQVVEHCQDVVEDFMQGRVYLPADDLARFGCELSDLSRAPTSAALRRTIGLQVARSRELLEQADPLLAQLRGWALPLVAAYAAGGLATCDALERNAFDVASATIRPARRDFVRRWLGLLWRRMIWPRTGISVSP